MLLGYDALVDIGFVISETMNAVVRKLGRLQLSILSQLKYYNVHIQEVHVEKKKCNPCDIYATHGSRVCRLSYYIARI